MPAKKTADLSSSLVAIKGSAVPSADSTGRQPEFQHAQAAATEALNLATLNFKVAPEFRHRFRKRAAEADLKLNELLREALEAWEEKRRVI
jgi:hypothetical protein